MRSSDRASERDNERKSDESDESASDAGERDESAADEGAGDESAGDEGADEREGQSEAESESEGESESDASKSRSGADGRLRAGSRDLTRLGRYGYIAGLCGAVAILVMGYFASRRHILERGWGLSPSSGPFTPEDAHRSRIVVLLVCAAVMFAVELITRFRVDRGRVISIPETLRNGRVASFVRECLLVYAAEVGILSLALFFYRIANEYNYIGGSPYYKPWLAIMESFWWVYICAGLPYVLLTRALQHDPRADRKQLAFTVFKAARIVTTRGKAREAFDRYDRTAVLGFFVKLFYIPIMTVFFADQFLHLVKNYDYVLDNLLPAIQAGERGHATIGDFYNVSFSVIFSIDVGLAWAGYVFSSRWIKNTLYSVEPTLLGWMVALLSYPPFNRVFGFYFSTPGENGFLSIGSRPVVTLLAVASVISFVVYMSATVCFGLRFSNLTHRGIIKTGPYSVVRHPAYAAKNFSWWCVMLPFAIYQGVTQRSGPAFVQVVGLAMMSGIYYLRAITEERHLAKDPEYRAYMREVPYRFIPGLL